MYTLHFLLGTGFSTDETLFYLIVIGVMGVIFLLLFLGGILKKQLLKVRVKSQLDEILNESHEIESVKKFTISDLAVN